MQDQRDLREVLKAELEFLRKGGYRNPNRHSWRYQYFLEDSPACPNYGLSRKQCPCSGCILIDLVPREHRQRICPCRDIPLNAQGETLRHLYTYADQQEIEQTYEAWLRKLLRTIDQLIGQPEEVPDRPPEL